MFKTLPLKYGKKKGPGSGRRRLCLLALAAMLLVGSSALGQTEPAKKVGFVGPRYTSLNDGASHVVITLGAAVNLTGNLYSMSYANVGGDGTVATTLAFLMPVSSQLRIGPTLGPGVDVTGNQDDWTAYLGGIVGGVVSYRFKPDSPIGIAGYFEQKFSFESGTRYPDGYVAGAVLFFNI